jgi:molecular chaperone DnaK
MAKPRAIGIDLGTTNSAAAWVDESGHTVMIPNTEGDLLTPSVVLFDDAEVIVGKEARSATVLNPDRVAVWVKRDMGAPIYNRAIRGEFLPPEVIQACILRKLKADVVHKLGAEARVVITVPAYFDEPRRKATADAGEMAGLTVLDIVNEPTAGALAFGEVLGYLAADSAPRQELTVLVYDLGGGTFDATLLKLSPASIQTLATDGDVQLGGYDWDLRVVDYVAEAFLKAHGVDPRENATAMGRLFNAATDAKHALSARNQATLRLDYEGHAIEVPLTREKFEDLTGDLLERTAYTTRQLIATAGLSWKDISRVLLVGGSTRMPMVPRMLRQLTGMEPDRSVNPDEAVARGAALYANFLLAMSQPGATPGFQVVNVNSHSLGIEGIEPETLRKTNIILIPRNTPLPARCTERFATKSDGQRSIVLQVLEGDSSLPGECTAIGRTVIRDLPPGLPKGWPVDITFEYASNGRLTVNAAVSGTSRQVALDMERDVGLSNDGIARWKQAVAGQSGFDAFESLLTDVLNLAAPGVKASLPGDPAAAFPSVAGVATPAVPAGGPGMAPAAPTGAAAPTPLQPLPLPSSGKKAHWIAAPSGVGVGASQGSAAPPSADATSAPSPALRFPAAPQHFQSPSEQWQSPADAIGLPEASVGSSGRLPSLRLDAAPAAPIAAGLPPIGAIPLPQALAAAPVGGDAAPATAPLPGAAPAPRRGERGHGALRKLFNLLALTLGGLVGIAIAYFILHKLQPQMFHWPR